MAAGGRPADHAVGGADQTPGKCPGRGGGSLSAVRSHQLGQVTSRTQAKPASAPRGARGWTCFRGTNKTRANPAFLPETPGRLPPLPQTLLQTSSSAESRPAVPRTLHPTLSPCPCPVPRAPARQGPVTTAVLRAARRAALPGGAQWELQGLGPSRGGASVPRPAAAGRPGWVATVARLPRELRSLVPSATPATRTAARKSRPLVGSLVTCRPRLWHPGFPREPSLRPGLHDGHISASLPRSENGK